MKKTKPNLLLKSSILILLVIALCPILYVAKTSLTLKKRIELQKHNEESFNNLEKERISVAKNCKFFEKRETKDNSDFLREIGPIPEGKFISSFSGEGEGTYDYRQNYMAYGKRAVSYLAKEPRRYYDGSLVRDYFGNVEYEEVEKVKYVTEPYWDYTVKKLPFKYTYSLTTFDLSDSISSNTPDSVYENLTKQFVGQLSSYKSFKFSPAQWKCVDENDWVKWYDSVLPKNRLAVAYSAKDQKGQPVMRYVFFNNQRAYMFEIHSEYQLNAKAKWMLKSFTTFYLQDYNDRVNMSLLLVILGSIVFVVLSLVCLLIPNSVLKKRKVSLSMQAKLLSSYVYLAWIVNIICIFADIYPVYIGEIRQDGYWWAVFLLFLCAVCMNVFTKLYIMNKVCLSNEFDYLVPKWLKSYLYNRHITDAEYKSVVVFWVYPCLILGNLSFSLCVLAYILPVSLLAIILLEIRNFSKWSRREESGHIVMNEEFGTFKDYYLLLDIGKNASEEDIDKAFNKAMAKYNSGVDGKLYGEVYRCNIQEAYRVLSSTNRLRPEYDKEFDVYRASNASNYQYSDEGTKNDIVLIQKEFYGEGIQEPDKKSVKQYNSIVRGVYIFFVLVIIASAILFVPFKKHSNRHDGDSRESLWNEFVD